MRKTRYRNIFVIQKFTELALARVAQLVGLSSYALRAHEFDS